MLCTAPRGPQSGLSSLLITVALLSHVSETCRSPESWILRLLIDIYRFDREMVKDTHLIFLVYLLVNTNHALFIDSHESEPARV